MTISANTVSLSNALIESKSILSRLLAGENIDVQHQPVHTASFDVQNRVLTLPMWENMTNEVYDMLVGHEVAHALFTPAGMDPLMDAVSEINKSDFAGAKDALNIVEDARIERLMKDKFPGLVRDFRIGYDRMHEDGIFGNLPASSADMTLLDRVNLHFKLEDRYAVSFTAVEQDLVDRIALATDWDDVVALANELYWMAKDQQEEKQGDQPNDDQPEEGESGSGGVSAEGGESSDESGEGQSQGGGEATDDESDESGSADSSSDSDNEQGEDSGQSMDDDTDTGESADSVETDSNASPDGHEGGVDGSTLERSSTMQNMEDALTNRSQDAGEKTEFTTYGTLPTNIDFSKVVVPCSEITDALSGCFDIDTKIALKSYADSFLRDQKLLVNVMAKQFDMKKAADVNRRAKIAKTGVLDTVKMVNYKFSEDIFLRNTVLPKGKNHGMIIMVDWSGSMDNMMGDTLQQAINLIMFCKRIGVPFEVYGFTTGWTRRRYDSPEVLGSLTKGKNEFYLSGDGFDLLELTSSNLSPTEYAQSLVNMVTLMDWFRFNGRGNKSKVFNNSKHDYYMMDRRLGLGGTPLDDAIACTAPMIMRMRKAGVQHPTAVFLTDGCTGTSPIKYDGRLNGQDTQYYGNLVLKVGNKIVEGKDSTSQMLNWLRMTTGCRTIGYFLCDSFYSPGINFDNHEDWLAASNKFEETKFLHSTEVDGYDHYFVFNPATAGKAASAFDNLPENASATRAKTAFIKQAAAKKAERSMLSTLAGNFAEV